MKTRLMASLLILTSFATVAEEKGYTGFTLDVGVSGFFSPELVSADVKKIDANSPADKAGIQVGDKLIAIADCEIPGCPAKKGKTLITKQKGQQLPLTLQRDDGTVYSVNLIVE